MGSPTSEQDVVISDCVRSGSSQTDCNSWYRAESPQRVVELTRSFWKMETEVTQGQFQRVMGYNPSHFKNCGLNCPVESVNWHEACAFANALSRKQGFEECYTCSGSGTGVTCEVKSQYSGSGYYNCKGWRLPTEAEWEYAARSGVHAAIYKGKFEIKGFSNAPALDPIAWYSGNSGVSYEGGFDCSNWSEKQYSSSRCGTHPVGRKQSNMWGLHDMLGNVFEWVHDWYQDSYRDLTGKDPVNDRTGSERVLRGGSWNFHARVMRAANRFWWTPTNRFFYVGFRLLRGDLSSR
jgi:formylglycine-generating enzyme required for sulfatase activity